MIFVIVSLATVNKVILTIRFNFLRKEITHMNTLYFNNTMMMMCSRSMMMSMVSFDACYVPTDCTSAF